MNPRESRFYIVAAGAKMMRLPLLTSDVSKQECARATASAAHRRVSRPEWGGR